MTEQQNEELYEMARLLCETGKRINTAFGNRINQLIDGYESPHEYAPLINDHANHTATMTKLIYMLKTWEEL